MFDWICKCFRGQSNMHNNALTFPQLMPRQKEILWLFDYIQRLLKTNLLMVSLLNKNRNVTFIWHHNLVVLSYGILALCTIMKDNVKDLLYSSNEILAIL